MRILILNCDNDLNPATNGAALIRRRLREAGARQVTIRDAYDGDIPAASELDSFDGIVITGSKSAAYERRRWISRLCRLIRAIDERGIPALGICFGHQIIAQALGGRVEASGTFEEGFKGVDLTAEGRSNSMLLSFPRRFKAYQSHGDIVTRTPRGAVTLATSGRVLQVYGIRNILCVQFHPEILHSTAVAMARRDGRNVRAILGGTSARYSTPARVFSNFLNNPEAS